MTSYWNNSTTTAATTTSNNRNSNNDNLPLLASPAQSRHSSNDGGEQRAVSSFWWPSPETSGGFLSAIHNAQHPKDCSAESTKFFVMRSLKNNDGDNRGLSGKRDAAKNK